MEKKKITIEDAQRAMYEKLEKVSMGDKVYEFAQDIFQGFINMIETENEIKDAEERLESDQEWYDEIQEDFYQTVYDKLTDFLKNGE